MADGRRKPRPHASPQGDAPQGDGEVVDGSLKYSDVVLDHARNPRNAGDVEDTAATAQIGDPETGDVLRISMRIEDGIVVEARFKAFGCTAAIAAGSMATTLLEGLSVEAAAIQEALRRHHALRTVPQEKEAVRCRS